MIDSFASERQYIDHLAGIWLALDPSERGTFYTRRELADHMRRLWINAEAIGYAPRSNRVTLVASIQDYDAMTARGRPTIYVEHGAGQTYVADPGHRGHKSYSGSGGHDGCVLFLCPSEIVADRWRAQYPDTPAEVVGCPRLDRWHQKPREDRDGAFPTTVAISFHADIPNFVPEVRSAFRHYRAGLPSFVADAADLGWRVIGHGHPRLWSRIRPFWERLGVEAFEDWSDVLDALTTAERSCYVADNSSTLPEAASCGVPLVWLSAPWFRRDVEHGARFWAWPRGQVQCDDPQGLAAAVDAALVDSPGVRAARERMVGEVYCATDGKTTERAVNAIRRVVR